jgi:hypothetical protein
MPLKKALVGSYILVITSIIIWVSTLWQQPSLLSIFIGTTIGLVTGGIQAVRMNRGWTLRDLDVSNTEYVNGPSGSDPNSIDARNKDVIMGSIIVGVVSFAPMFIRQAVLTGSCAWAIVVLGTRAILISYYLIKSKTINRK